jgi:hypothetical protein
VCLSLPFFFLFSFFSLGVSLAYFPCTWVAPFYAS